MSGRERAAALAFAVSTIASIVLAVVYWRGGQTQLEGVCLFLVTGGIGFGIVSWAKHATPHDEVTEERHSVASSDESFEEVVSEIEGDASLGRRRLLIALAGSAFAAMGTALLFPIRSLGPRPGKDLKSTPYAGGGMRVVTENGKPVTPEDLPADGVLTVWPEGHTDAADAPTLLIRTRSDQGFTPRRGREDWTVDGIVAYSKLCTHVGCPVGLYQAESGLLLCPCHQSTFNVLDGARPVFGPAARSLPQLPLGLDSQGNLVARGDFSDPVGPGFWDRDR
ncbi:MAG: ubiquinol-cytochrome c reductase iron-sulfur subunit [Acidimicrobiaceae bacterium]|jgi:ubiquinol-cytochrome c reductase iron-sulfur subunit